MSFIHRSGPLQTDFFPKTASTVFAIGTAVSSDANGLLVKATTGLIVGVLNKAAAASDSDYAVATKVPVIIPTDMTKFEADVTTGSANATMVGHAYDLDGSAGVGINVNGTTNPQFTITDVISTTKVLGKFNGAIQYDNI
jgi:hypothetical protein